jgi:hypothetical protein
MSVKQCQNCGRFKGASHSCPPAKKISQPIVKAPSFNLNTISPPSMVPSKVRAPVRPDPVKVAKILRNPKKLASAIKSLEFALAGGHGGNAEQDKMRVRLEASFGKIDWKA